MVREAGRLVTAGPSSISKNKSLTSTLPAPFSLERQETKTIQEVVREAGRLITERLVAVGLLLLLRRQEGEKGQWPTRLRGHFPSLPTPPPSWRCFSREEGAKRLVAVGLLLLLLHREGAKGQWPTRRRGHFPSLLMSPPILHIRQIGRAVECEV